MLSLGLVIAGTIVLTFAVAQAVDFGFFNLRITWLNADKRLSVFAVASLLAQAATAAVCVGHGYVVGFRREAWFTVGVLVGALVLVRGLASFNASVLAMPLACVFALLCVLTWNDGTSRRVVWAGLVLLAVSLLFHKVGLDADSSTASDYTWPYQLLGIVKHGSELAGWILIATGITAGVASTMSSVQVGTNAQHGPAVRISPSSD